VVFRPSGKFRGHPVMYRDHRKSPGGPPGGSTHPGGPHGLKWEGNQPIVGWCTPLVPPPAPRVETLGWEGAPHLPWGALHPPWPPPPWEIGSPRAGAPPGGLYKGRGEGGSRTLKSWRPLPLLHLFLLRHVLGEALPECCCSTTTTPLCCCWSHHHQPLLPPCWIKKEETSSAPYVC